MDENRDKNKTTEELSPEREQVEVDEELRWDINLARSPTSVRTMSLINIDGRAIIRLQVQGKDDQILMESSQDLEDTLALGASIVSAVAGILEDVTKILKQGAWREGIGEQFETNLEKVETATQRIRQKLKDEKGS